MRDTIATVLNTIKKYSWIINMGEKYLDIWTELVYKYAPKLDENPIKKETGYTRHDFSYHCKDIYHIIENVFLKEVNIEEEEYFVLASAVLLHDISMTKTHFDRLSHSQQSVKYIDDEINDGEDVWNNIDVQTIQAIEQVVRAHSDIKECSLGGKEIIKHYTLRETEECITGETCEIHVRWLAGILRLADELDITVSRKGVADRRFEELSDEDVDESYSKQCWKQLNYFESVRRNRAEIEIVLYERYLRLHLNDDKSNIASDIKFIRNKIVQQIYETNAYAFDYDKDYVNKIKTVNVKIIDNGVGFTESELGENLGRENIVEERLEQSDDLEDEDIGIEFDNISDNSATRIGEENIHQNIKSESDKSEIRQELDINVTGMPLCLDNDLCKDITDFIYSNGLVDYGHYRLNRRFCAEKWIDVRTVLSDAKLSRKISQIVSRDLKVYLDNNCINVKDVLLVGISINGNILASRVAFQLGIAFTYIIPTRPGICASDMEKLAEIDMNKKIILFTGAISSYDTITRVIEEYFEKTNILRVYTVFWRKIEVKYQMQKILENIRKEVERKIIFLNDDFPCEVLGNEKCVNRKYGNCIAKNEKAYEEIYDWPLAVKDNNSNRIFINNIIGCLSGCQYCYLKDIGIQQMHSYTFEEVIAEFERLHDVSPQKTIISFGCYAECMLEDNLPEMEKLIKYFAEKGYYLQISTKKKLNHDWLNMIESNLIKKAQLNIYVSLPTIKQAKVLEPNTDCVEDRMLNFKYQSLDGKIDMYMYIKPFLEDITPKDIEEYFSLLDKFKVKTIVGNGFRFDIEEGERIRVGKNEMYEKKSSQRDAFVQHLLKSHEVYFHSTEPIKERLRYEQN